MDIRTQFSLLSNLTDNDVFSLHESVLHVAGLLLSSYHSNRLVCIYGNGGSAADAQHFSAELVATFDKFSRPPLPVVSLTTDTSFITAWSNDYSFDQIFSRQIQAFQSLLFLSIGLSTSGTSPNVLTGLKLSHSLGHKTILITGANSPEYCFVDHLVRLPSASTALIQTLTQIFYHAVCYEVEKSLSSDHLPPLTDIFDPEQ